MVRRRTSVCRYMVRSRTSCKRFFVMKPMTAEKSDSAHPWRQNESTPERVLEAALTLLCEPGFSVGGIRLYLASPSRNDPALPEIGEDLQKHRFCLDIFVETKPAGF